MGSLGLATKAALQLIGLFRLVILARLLAPADFGLFGIALLAVGTVRTFTETGFVAALIQRRDSADDYLDTAFAVQLLRGCLLALAVYFAAPAVATFFEAPESLWVLRSMSLLLVIEGLASPGLVRLNRTLAFGRIYIVDIAEAAFGLITAIVFGVLLANVWALVLSILVGQTVRTFASYWAAPHRPRPELHWEKIREMARFGRSVFGSNILVYVLVNADDALVGKLLGATQLGFYQVAYRIGNLPATDLARVISQVGFPALSQVQDDTSALRERTRWGLRVTGIVALPASAALLVLSPDLVPALLGPAWAPAVRVLQVFCVFGAIRAINATFGALLWAVGKPSHVTRVSAIQLIMVAILALPSLNYWGMLGIAGVITLANASAMALLVARVQRLGIIAYRSVSRSLLPGLMVAGAVIVLVLGTEQLLPDHWTHLQRLVAQVAPLGVLVGALATWLRQALRAPHDSCAGGT